MKEGRKEGKKDSHSHSFLAFDPFSGGLGNREKGREIMDHYMYMSLRVYFILFGSRILLLYWLPLGVLEECEKT